MWIRSSVAVFMFCLLVGVVGYVAGCGSPADQPPSDGKNAAQGNKSPAETPIPPPKPILKDWQKPAFALVLTGERHGYLEPCGCSPTQSGGLSRLGDLFRQLDERGWPHAALDLGGSIRRDRLQTKFKFAALLDSLKDLKYAGMALGTEELRLEQSEPGYLLTRLEVDPKKPEAKLPFLAANVVFFGIPEFGVPGPENSNIPLVTRSRVIAAGGKKIGVTAVFGKGYRSTILPEGARGDLTIEDPDVALKPVVEELKKQSPDLMVLLSHASKDESTEIAKAFPDFQVVLTAGGPEDGDEEPEKIGNTWLLQVGHKGKYAGVLGFYPDDASQKLRFELVDLDVSRFKETPKMHDRMREYQTVLAENYDRILEDLPKAPHPTGAKFVGAAKCGECHKKAYQKWKNESATDPHHARAFKSLSIGRKGQEKNWISRTHDPECLSCHVTGWEPQEVFPYPSGFLSEKATPLLAAQQCENCHGPGSRHVEFEELWKKDRASVTNDELIEGRKALKLTVEIAKQRTCVRCHDYENSPKFNFESYWDRIRHPWKD
ncbi:MAG: multiheme c-type cytochrome [Planctomycetaceae bacterium]